jgi:plastocyanin
MSSFRLLRWTLRPAAIVATIAAFWMAAGNGAAPAEAGGGGCHAAPAEVQGSGNLVKITGSCFVPTVLYVAPGTNVEFRNDDPVLHALSGVGANQPIAQKLDPTESATRTFSAPGIYPYYCNLHLGMAGVIVVGDALSANSQDVRASVAVQPAPAGPAAPVQPAAPAAVAANRDDSGLPGVAIAALGALTGLGLAAAVLGPLAFYRRRR